jgi:hypothetical protein
MEHSFNQKIENHNSRHGFHYFPDNLHYRLEDLHFWVPELKALGAAWLVLQAETVRAIPEEFIQGLIQEKIEPIIHLPLDLSNPIPADQLESLLSAYAKWGVHYVIFFDRPNVQGCWGAKRWSQANLISAFIDQFLPLAEMGVIQGLTPMFPPLEPGGQYWDTVFLQQSLEEMQKRGADRTLAHMGMSAYAWTWGKSLNWGAGGSEQWPLTKPYRIPANSQDQRGLRVYDWYQSIAKKVLHKTCPMILMQAGKENDSESKAINVQKFVVATDTTINIIKLLANENVYEGPLNESILQPIPDEVICGNFWILSCSAKSINSCDAWIDESGIKSALAQSVLEWIKSSQKNLNEKELFSMPEKPINEPFSISRYLYFPSLEYFMENEQREEIQEYLMRHQPTIGFSLKEAAHAAIVDIGAEDDQIPDGVMDALRQYGCSVRRLLNSRQKEVNEDYGEELGDYPSEKKFDYV